MSDIQNVFPGSENANKRQSVTASDEIQSLEIFHNEDRLSSASLFNKVFQFRKT